MKKMNAVKILTASLFIFPGIKSFASAVSIDVWPTANEIKVAAGGSYAGKITVKNVSEETIEVNSSVQDWVYEAPSGAKKMLPKGTGKFSCAPWLTYSPATFKLGAGESRDVQFSVTPPTSAAGGYYSLIVFGGGTEKAKSSNGITINIQVRMSSILLVEIEKTQNVKGSLKDLKILNAKANQPLEVETRFKNEGNVRVHAKGRLSILDSNGNSVGWTEFPTLKTLPGDEWPAKASWAGLDKGTYKLVATFELAPGKIIVKEKDVKVE